MDSGVLQESSNKKTSQYAERTFTVIFLVHEYNNIETPLYLNYCLRPHKGFNLFPVAIESVQINQIRTVIILHLVISKQDGPS